MTSFGIWAGPAQLLLYLHQFIVDHLQILVIEHLQPETRQPHQFVRHATLERAPLPLEIVVPGKASMIWAAPRRHCCPDPPVAHARENSTRGRKGTRALLCYFPACVVCRAQFFPKTEQQGTDGETFSLCSSCCRSIFARVCRERTFTDPMLRRRSYARL